MKVLPFKIPKPEKDGLIFQIDYTPLFYDKLHQHEEIQISFILEGEGTLVIGDSINHFTKEDILIIGSNLPHVFKSDKKSTSVSHMYTLFFTKASFGKSFFELEELLELQPFFKRSKHGFKIASQLKPAKDLFYQLKNTSKFGRFIILLELLKISSKCQYKSLSSFVYNKKYTDHEGYRMRNVFEFTMNNFEQEITLNTISKIANMTKNSFCKYFKKEQIKRISSF